LSSRWYPDWGSVALNNFDIEINIRVKWDWLSTKRCLGISSSISIV